MTQLRTEADDEQIVQTMIALARPSNLHRTIIAGNDSTRLYVALRRRGFIRLATPTTCRVPRKQHAVALIAAHSLLAVEAALAEVSPFLSANAAIAVRIVSRDAEACLRIRDKLQHMGFRIEAGVRCQQALVLSAHRQGFAQMDQAA